MCCNLPSQVNKQREKNRYACSLKCKNESMAINNTVTYVYVSVLGQIWTQAALLDRKQ